MYNLYPFFRIYFLDYLFVQWQNSLNLWHLERYIINSISNKIYYFYDSIFNGFLNIACFQKLNKWNSKINAKWSNCVTNQIVFEIIRIIADIFFEKKQHIIVCYKILKLIKHFISKYSVMTASYWNSLVSKTSKYFNMV